MFYFEFKLKDKMISAVNPSELYDNEKENEIYISFGPFLDQSFWYNYKDNTLTNTKNEIVKTL
jgi:hypothetical protein